jgi:hypothetical protein
MMRFVTQGTKYVRKEKTLPGFGGEKEVKQRERGEAVEQSQYVV